jgi:hypothetical protein
MEEVDDGPGHAGGAVEDGEYDDPREEEDEDVGRPHARDSEPLGVPVQIRRRHRSDVHVRVKSPSFSEQDNPHRRRVCERERGNDKAKKIWMAGGDGEEKEREALVWENGAGEG